MTEARTKRRLAAILAADVVGYSRMIEADEAGTLARLKALRHEIVDPALAEHGGRIVKLMGDGLLAEFASVVDAVACAVAMQRAMAGRDLSIRIGVNLGDVVVEGDDLLGDGVNIAARLEGIAEPGGIVISAMAYENLKGKTDLACEDLGPQRLKNIAEKVRAYRVRVDARAPSPMKRKIDWRPPMLAAGVVVVLIGAGLAWWPPWMGPPPAAVQVAERPTVAVLPFANLSGDPQQEYFSDGISEDLLTALTRFSRLKVIGRNSSFRYKGQAVDLRKVGEELGARYVLEGSVRREGERVRITAQLIEAATGTHLWAEKYDRPFKDLFEIGDEVVNRVAGALAGRVLTSETERAQRKPPEKMDAYDLTLRGRAVYLRGDRDSYIEGRHLLERAIALDPTYAQAHAHLSTVHLNFYVNRWNEEFTSPLTLEKIVGEAKWAYQLDPGDAFVLARYANALTFVQQYEEALSFAERAIAISPNDPDILFGAGPVFQRVGLHSRTTDIVSRAMQIDPDYAAVWENTLSRSYFAQGDYAQAVAAVRRCVPRAPNNTLCHSNLVAALSAAGLMPEARTAAATLLRINPGFNLTSVSAGMVHFQDRAFVDRFVAALRAAGVPE